MNTTNTIGAADSVTTDERAPFAAETGCVECQARIADRWAQAITAIGAPFLAEMVWRLAAECVAAGDDDTPDDTPIEYRTAAGLLCDAFERLR